MLFVRSPLIGFLIGVMLLGIGVIAAFLLSATTTLTCARNALAASRCELVSTRLLDSQTQQFWLRDLRGASVERSINVWSRRRRSSYRVVLQTKAGPIPLTSSYSSMQTEQQRVANEINAFVASRSRPVLKIAQHDDWTGYLVGGAFVLVGLLFGSGSARRSGFWGSRSDDL